MSDFFEAEAAMATRFDWRVDLAGTGIADLVSGAVSGLGDETTRMGAGVGCAAEARSRRAAVISEMYWDATASVVRS
ncbi:hypothetical protein [Edaphobacter dinghuensis]|uniref:hypothetical protein n=1 Tax=Edaphobacter dinghuensis TaxID=1560005 RepID=UPI00166695BA|nr:hypothetical protein [Edaphobacter dinghuensis]